MSDPLKDAKVPKPGASKPKAAETMNPDAAEAARAKAEQLKSAGAATSGGDAAASDGAPEVVMPSQGAPPAMEIPTKDGKPLIARRATNTKRVSWFGQLVTIKAGKVLTVLSYGLPGLASFERQGVEFEDIFEE